LKSADVCRQAGVTYRQLDYWQRMGLYPDLPRVHGCGIAREWAPRHVAITALWGCLFRLGADHGTLASMADWATDLPGPWSGMLIVTPHPGEPVREVADRPTLTDGAAWVVDLGWCWDRCAQHELTLV
jgi:hypothetical protein